MRLCMIRGCGCRRGFFFDVLQYFDWVYLIQATLAWLYDDLVCAFCHFCYFTSGDAVDENDPNYIPYSVLFQRMQHVSTNSTSSHDMNANPPLQAETPLTLVVEYTAPSVEIMQRNCLEDKEDEELGIQTWTLDGSR